MTTFTIPFHEAARALDHPHKFERRDSSVRFYGDKALDGFIDRKAAIFLLFILLWLLGLLYWHRAVYLAN